MQTQHCELAPLQIQGRKSILVGARQLGFSSAAQQTRFRFWQAASDYTPEKINDYYFSPSLTGVLNFHLHHGEQQGLWIWGLHGTGKTSLVEQVAAYTNTEVFHLNGTLTTESADLVGSYRLVGGEGGTSMVFVEGPLVKAMRQGGILLVNEVDIIDPGELAVLHDVLEGKPVDLPSGERVRPEVTFRIVCTANTCGRGDRSGHYPGTLMMNKAFMDRFLVVQAEYLPAEVEEDLLAKSYPTLAPMLPRMVGLANRLRDRFAGEAGDGTGELQTTLSTRTLMYWAKVSTLAMASGSIAKPLWFGLELAVLNRASAEDREAISRFFEAMFHDESAH